jgi:hypothetical protein
LHNEAIHNFSISGRSLKRKRPTLTTHFHRKATHTGRYLNYKSDHPPHVKGGIIQGLSNKATIICEEKMDNVTGDL